jgi:carbon-monoxide dehydrogenase medium subunit
MIPASCEYSRATSLAHALELLERNPEATLLAGGQSLIPMMKLRLAMPEHLVDIGGLRELSYVVDAGDHIAIGALTRHFQLAENPVLVETVPLLAEAVRHVGDPQVRHWGTIGGSLCHADPGADLGAAALALGAELVVQGRNGRRVVEADRWFVGYWTTAIEPAEMLVEIRVPKPRPGAGWAFVKLTRRAIDWATVGVAVHGARGEQRVALMCMENRPLRAAQVEAELAGGAPPAEAALRASEDTQPRDDALASATYRRKVVVVLTRRALVEAERRGAVARAALG